MAASARRWSRRERRANRSADRAESWRDTARKYCAHDRTNAGRNSTDAAAQYEAARDNTYAIPQTPSDSSA